RRLHPVFARKARGRKRAEAHSDCPRRRVRSLNRGSVKLGSLRWRLIGISGSLALIAALAVVAMLERRVSERSLAEIAETLEEEGDEVVAFLEDPDLAPADDDFLRIALRRRFKPGVYFCNITTRAVFRTSA